MRKTNLEAKITAKKALYEGFFQLYQYQLTVNGKNLTREVFQCRDCVLVLIYAPDIDSFLLLQEFRSGVFCNADNDDPFIYESVAGEIESGQTPEQAARLEAKQEAGVDIGELEHIATAYASPGRMTEKTYIYCARIAGTPVTGQFGLAGEGEEIFTQLIKRQHVYKMMDDLKIIDSTTLLALNWFRVRHP